MQYSKKYPFPRTNTLLLLGMFMFFNSASASLVGDTLTIRRLYPDVNTDFTASVSTLVENGTADLASPQPNHYTINPEATSIQIDFIGSGTFGSSEFNGLAFTGFSDTIENVLVSDVSGLSISSLDFGTNYINLNLAGSSFTSSSFLNLELSLDQNTNTSPVPIPGAILLFGSGLFGLIGYRYKKKQTT